MAHPSSSSSSGDSASQTVVLFPFMAQGHLNPFLDFARHLATLSPSLSITIVSTTANVLNLRPRFLSYPTISFSTLSFHHHAQNTDSLSTHSAISDIYRRAESQFQVPFRRLISDITAAHGGRPPICIISDMFLGFTVDVAHRSGSRHVTLYTSGPFAMSIYNSIWTHFPHKYDTSSNPITLPGLNITIERSQLSKNMLEADPEDPSSLFTKRQAEFCSRSDGSLWNTLEILEKPSLDNWAKSFGKRVWAVGPLLPVSSKEYERGGKEAGLSPADCAAWLDRKPPGSVIYAAFGSQNSLPVAQMKELANGLEKSGYPFIWVVRNPTGFDVEEEFRPEWLPEGFEAKVKASDQGLIVRRWAPQMQILSHVATGAFLSHCGWNSVLESLSRGVVVIGWPLGSEQFYNAKLLVEELRVCVEVGRGIDVVIDGGDLAEKLRSVMDGGDLAEKLRGRATRLREEIERAVGPDGSSKRALDDFLDTLMTWSKEMLPRGDDDE